MLNSLKNVVKKTAISHILKQDARLRGCGPEKYYGLAPDVWDATISDQGHLCWDGINLVELASSNSGPFHIVSRRKLEENYHNFKAAFSRPSVSVELGTSYKTNPLPSVLNVLHDAGSYAEVISEFELWLALHLKLSPERIIFNGPGKTRASLKLAIENGIKLINFDGLWEIPIAAELANKAGRTQHVGVRVVSSVGWSGQFGLRIDSGEAMRAFESIANYPQLLPQALHLHLGTGVKDATVYKTAVREVLQFAEDLKNQLGVNINCFDFGGGFPVPTVRSMDEWDGRMVAYGYPARFSILTAENTLDKFAGPVMDQVEDFCERTGLGPLEIIFEPGRAITSSAQLLLLSVLAVKERGSGQRDVILNGGKNITMPLGWETHQIFVANKLLNSVFLQQDLFGPLCHPGDIVAKNLLLPELEQDDIVAIMDSGAYFIPNQMNFSNPRTAVFMIDEGQVKCIREQEQFEDIIRHDII